MRAFFTKLRRNRWLPVLLGVVLIGLTLASRLAAAHYLANDEPNDGKMYAQIARNLLEQNVFSIETEAPYTPTLIRLPGYPFFIAGVYTIFGHDNNEAVRLAQGVVDTLTCVLVALIAFNWTTEDAKKRRAALIAFMLAAVCPFVMIYAATILTETLTTFLLAAMTLTATYAFKAKFGARSLLWWTLTGLIAGIAVSLRPDSGLFAAGIGLTIVISGLFERSIEPQLSKRLLRIFICGMIFSTAFMLTLVPWTIRNERLFHVFQPLAPAHAEMPGEFVPRGFNNWVGTWIDDQRYIAPTLWNLDDKPITVEQLPAEAFDSDEERSRVAALLNQYDNPPKEKSVDDQADADDAADNKDNAAQNDDADDKSDNADNKSDNADDKNDSADDKNDDADSADDKNSDDKGDDSNDNNDDDEDAPPVKMTPEIDAGFAQIATERIARNPMRYYLVLPAKRAAALWFDTHSTYYPFAGELFPTDKLDHDEHQEIWLPVFTFALWFYTLLALFGAITMFLDRKKGASMRWLLLTLLLTLPRVAFFASLENPEPRYVVELFIFTAILGGIALARISFDKKQIN